MRLDINYLAYLFRMNYVYDILNLFSRLDFEDIVINSLARESRLVLILSGRTLLAPDGNDKDAPPQYKQEDIGWAAIQFFNYEG